MTTKQGQAIELILRGVGVKYCRYPDIGRGILLGVIETVIVYENCSPRDAIGIIGALLPDGIMREVIPKEWVSDIAKFSTIL